MFGGRMNEDQYLNQGHEEQNGNGNTTRIYKEVPNRIMQNSKVPNGNYATIRVPFASLGSEEDFQFGRRRNLMKVMLPDGSVSLSSASIIHDNGEGEST